jgi:ADP-heptose:LPS heptosyltransferase
MITKKENSFIAVFLPHKGIGDIIFHHSFLKSISEHHKKKIILFASKSSKANFIYDKSDFVKKVILVDLRRPNIFLYLYKVLYVAINLSKFRYKILYYTGRSKWHLIAIKMLSIINNFKIYTNNKRNRFIIDFLNDFLKKEKIINRNNFKLNPSLDSSSKFVKEINKFKKPWVFLSIDTSENQIQIKNMYLLEIIKNLKKKYNTIFVNTSVKNSHKTKYLDDKCIQKTHHLNISQINYVIKNSKLFVGNESGPAIISIIYKIKSFIFVNKNIIPESKKMPNLNKRYYIHVNMIKDKLKRIF